MKLKIVILLMIIASTLSAQKIEQIDNIDVLKAHTKVLEEKYPGMMSEKVVSAVYKVDEDHTRIVYNENGVHTEELVYNPVGKMIIIATYIRVSKEVVPPIVLDAYSKNAIPTSKVSGYYEVRPLYGGEYYFAVEYMHDGMTERVYFTNRGRKRKGPR